MTDQDPKGILLDDMDLTVRTANCLKNEGFKTLGDCLSYTESEYLRIPNFGRKSLNELNDALVMHGLKKAAPGGRKSIYVVIPPEVFNGLSAIANVNNLSLEAQARKVITEWVCSETAKPDIYDRVERLEEIVRRAGII